MSLFSKPKVVLWPKDQSVDLYLDKAENNIFSVDTNLWKTCTESEIQSLNLLLNQNSVAECTILIPDDVVFTKSFIYDTETKSIEKSEVVGLAESFVHFKIHPDYIDYKLIPSSGKTIIQAHIFDRSKIESLKSNLGLLSLKSFSFESVSQSISKIISSRFENEYFLLFPLNQNEYTLLLSKKDSVYLTANLKGPTLDVQKIVNYSNLYFSTPTTKFYIPGDRELDINATSPLDKTPYNQSQLAKDLNKAPNLPLPVLGIFASNIPSPAIINTVHNNSDKPKMENKKNFLPFILVFLITAVIASVIIWFVLNKNNTTTIENPVSSSDVTPTIVEAPTETPTPVIADVSKKLKLQVLNATDINGQAAVLKEKLTALGFTSIAVGNAKENLTANKIQLKASLSSDSAYFQSQLAGFFDAVPTTDLKETSTYDVVFTIGTDLGKAGTPPSETATDTVAPTKKPTPTLKLTPTATTSATVTPAE
jgi:hypothetical protein